MPSGTPVTCVGERDFYGIVSVDAQDDKEAERREAERTVLADVLRELDAFPGWPMCVVPPAPPEAPERTVALDFLQWKLQELAPQNPIGKLIEYSYKLHCQWTASIFFAPRNSRIESSSGETPLVRELHRHGTSEGEGWARTSELAVRLAKDDAKLKAFLELAREAFDKDCPRHCPKKIIAYTLEEPTCEAPTSDVVGLFDARARQKWRLHIHCMPALSVHPPKTGVVPSDAIGTKR
jgi:hypothetical protein